MTTPRVSIDALPGAATPLNPADILIVQQSGVTKKVAAPDLIASLDSRIDDLETQLAALDARVAALEGEPEPPDAGLFPTEATAGVPSGWTPITTLGPTTITTNGAVVENTRFNGSVTVNANNVTIRNCEILDGFINNWAGAMIRGPLLIENVSMIRTPASADESDPPAVTAGNYTARNVKIVDYAEGFRTSGDLSEGGGPILIENCWVRVVEPPGATDWHGDGVQAYGDFEGTTIRNSYIYCDTSGTSPIFYPDQFNSNLVLDKVIAEGGGWTVVLGMPSQITNLYVVDDSWAFGPVDNLVQPDPFNGWTCTLNVDGQPVIVAPIIL